MAFARRSQINSAKTITRLAEKKIEKKTGMRVSLIAYTDHHIARSPEKMMVLIADTLGMDKSAFTLRSRARPVVELRFLTAYFLRNYFPTITLCQISALFGGQDHTSIMNGLARTAMLLEVRDESFVSKYDQVLKAVNQWLRKESIDYATAICA